MDLAERRLLAERLMAERPSHPDVGSEWIDTGSVRSLRFESRVTPPVRTVVYFHGGGFRVGSAVAWTPFCSHLAVALDATVIAVDYSLAPERPFPRALDEGAEVLSRVLDHTDPSQVLLGGDSAGGNLAAAIMLCSSREVQPAGMFVMSPWVDLRLRAASYEDNGSTDQLFSRQSATEAAALYAAGQDVDSPAVSPVLGDWTGRPPMLIQVSSSEVLVDDARALAAAARSDGVDVTLTEYPDQPHVWPLSYPAGVTAVSAVAETAAFVTRVAPGRGRRREGRDD